MRAPAPNVVVKQQYDGDPKRILRPKDAMKKLGISHGTLYKLVQQGVIPKPIKMGKASGWRQEVLDALVFSPEPEPEPTRRRGRR